MKKINIKDMYDNFHQIIKYIESYTNTILEQDEVIWTEKENLFMAHHEFPYLMCLL